MQKFVLRITCPVWCSLVLHLAQGWNLKITFFSKWTQQRFNHVVGSLQKEVLMRIPFQNPLDASFLHRSIYSFFLPGRSRGQLDSYSAHPLPFPFLLCATSGSGISIQLHYQHPPPYHLIAATSGTTYFCSFVSFTLGLVMSGPRAIGRDSPGKNIIWCQTLFFLAWLCGAGERTMYLFLSPPPDILCSPFLFLPCLINLFFTSTPHWHLAHCTSHLQVSKKGSRAVKLAGLTHFPLLGGNGFSSRLSERRGLCVFNLPLPLRPKKIIFNNFL